MICLLYLIWHRELKEDFTDDYGSSFEKNTSILKENKLMLFKCIQQKSERENFKIILQVCLYNRNVTGDHATGLIFKVFFVFIA